MTTAGQDPDRSDPATAGFLAPAADPATAETEGAAAAPSALPAGRVLAVDVTRGLVMFMSVSAGFGLGTLAEDPHWSRVGRWFHHVSWEGAVAWDMIQPAFLTLAGISLTLAYTRRRERGSTPVDDLRHVLLRALKLIALSQVLVWVARGERTPQLIDALSQLALASIPVVLLMRRRVAVQVAVGVTAMVLHAVLHYAFPGPDGAWSGQRPVGMAIDQAIFRWQYYDAAYSTLNALPSIVWVLAGSWVGRWLLASRHRSVKARNLAVIGVVTLLAGRLLAFRVPMVKQLCTPSFVLFSLGVVLLVFAIVYFLTDVLGFVRWGWGWGVMGRNTLVVYSIDMILLWWVDGSLAVFTDRFSFLGLFGSVVQALATALAVWALCLWLYRRNIVVKL